MKVLKKFSPTYDVQLLLSFKLSHRKIKDVYKNLEIWKCKMSLKCEQEYGSNKLDLRIRMQKI